MRLFARPLLLCLLFAVQCIITPNGWAREWVEDATIRVAASDEAGFQQLSPNHARYFIDELNRGPDAIHQLPADAWSAIARETINVGPLSVPVWFHLRLHNTTGDAVGRILELRWINLRWVDFYQRRSDGQWLHHQAGLNVPSDQQYLSGSSYLFPIELNGGEYSDIYFRVDTQFNALMPLFLWQRIDYFRSHAQQLMVYFVAFGVLAAMMLYNLSLYVFTRERSYCYYSIYALSILVYELAASGIGNQFIWGGFEWTRLHLYAVSINLSFLCGVLFVRYFLQLKQYGGWLLLLNNLSLWYWSLSLVMVLLGSSLLHRLGAPVSMFTCVSGLITGIYLWRGGNVSARYFTIAWATLIVCTMLTVQMIEGRLPYNFLTVYGQLIGFIVELLLLSFALAERINRERRNRELAQREALALQTQISAEREERVQAQAQLLDVQQKANEELETRVAERTEALVRAMAELEKANTQMAKLSRTDQLTGLGNRRFLDEVLEQVLDSAQRTAKPLSVIMVDIDHFKQINDTYGHPVGDECLRLVGATLRKLVTRGTDVIARYGGEEFVVVLAETSETDAYRVAQRICEEVAGTQFIASGQRIALKVSLGVAAYDHSGTMTTEVLMANADQALYSAKDQGRNRVVRASAITVAH